MAPSFFASIFRGLLLGGGLPPVRPAATTDPRIEEEEEGAAQAPDGSSGCPFGFGAANQEEVEAAHSHADVGAPPPPLFGRQKVVHLYEQYIHLPALRNVWEHPVTDKPELEPCFASACHAIEICFLLLAHFLRDTRAYVVKRPRVELVAEDLARQCALLAEIVDGELEEDPPLESPPVLTITSPAVEAFSTKPLSTNSSTSSADGGAWAESPVDILVSPLSTDSLSSLATTTVPPASGAIAAPPAMPDTPLALGSALWSCASLTQDFPFPGCPPTTCEAARSPALELLHDAVCHALPTLSLSDRVSLVKVIRNITHAVEGLVQSWTVGLGPEAQLNSLRELVGLPRLLSFDADTTQKRVFFLDYARLVRPEVVAETYARALKYAHAEDFFFRSVHLGTECWAFVALARLEGARELASRGEWHNAAARARQAAHILTYLGRHVLMLTSMILRDYLELKVEIEGTSGEGSRLVKAFRPTAKRLFDPLKTALLALQSPSEEEGTEEEGRVRHALLRVYEAPERFPQHYTYAKALELLETGMASFYYDHYSLAANVIGPEARGTMNRAVKALKATYETGLFPALNQTRSTLGTQTDARLRHLKGNLLRQIMDETALRV